MFEDRAEPPGHDDEEEAYGHLSAWLSVLINEGDDEAPRIQRLGGKSLRSNKNSLKEKTLVLPSSFAFLCYRIGKIQAFGDGSFLSGVEVPFNEEETWTVTAEGGTPLAALRGLFTEVREVVPGRKKD